MDDTMIPRQRTVETYASNGESLLYSAMRDEASALNRTATEIWELCDGTKTIGTIARALGQRYGVDEADLLADVAATVAMLRARGLVDVLSGAGNDGT
jgi:pyrroloquinoline quinone biosynthesis protein D